MSSKPYLIKLKPLGNFYFGREYSFREHKLNETKRERKQQDKDETLSYIVESNYFPQQTALLGMLRFLLLRNSASEVFNNNKIVDTDKASALIGSSSFMLDSAGDFGKIESIGSCFICKGDNFLLPMPLDYTLNVDFEKATTASYCMQDLILPLITYKSDPKELYSAKNGVCEKLLSESSIIDYDYSEEKDKESGNVISKGIFVKDRRVGINRDITTGKVDENKNALYKQEFYRLAEGYEFAFTATLKDGINYTDYNGAVVELGGDNSKFSITFEQKELVAEYDKKEVKTQGIFKAVLLSDALIDDVTLSCFSISANTPMRFMKTNIVDTKNYSKIDKSSRQSLYKKGSVFYFDSESKCDSFIAVVESKVNFKKIGYNNIQKID